MGLAVACHFNPVLGCSSLAQDWLSDTNFCRRFCDRECFMSSMSFSVAVSVLCE